MATLTAMPAFAQEGGKGLPQFDTSLFPEQIFWLIVTFAFLYIMMAFVALPGVTKTQDRRAQTIAEEMNAARVANDAAQKAAADMEKTLADARSRASHHVNDMLASLADETLEEKTAKDHQLKNHLNAAESNIALARETALRKLHGEIAPLADAIVSAVCCKGERT
ncbi:MAG: F0F1 ATP synthase subunit B' [Alphaproteobacteria bacterium]|nr:F0F1 ATP synthase subunit B' [Alphaproteobacteria bacterium]